MLMKDDKKKTVAAIVSKIKDPTMQSSEPVPTMDGIEQDASIGLDAAGEELIMAIEAKDAKGIVTAIKSIMDMVEDTEEE